MNSYERVKTALEHKEADRVPFDLGGSVLTGINKKAYKNLRDYLGLPKKEIEIYDPMQQLARVDDDILEVLKVDVRCVDPEAAADKGLVTEPVEIDGYFHRTDEWGIKWRMPIKNGLYYDMLEGSLKDINDGVELEKFPWPNPVDENRFKTMKQSADKFVYEDKKAYILGRQSAGIWELALWMSGFEKLFMDMVLNESYFHALMEKITELKIQYWGKALDTVGENVLIVSEADDLATQTSQLCSLDMYKRLIHPYHKRLFDFIKKRAQAKVHIFYHTCGASKPFIPLLIEEGVDILNPVQVSAEGMDTMELKREFGKDIVFWGGGVDTQHVLPFGSVQDVKDEVKMRIEHLAKDGGFVFNTVHNVQGDVPPENFMAMWETLQEYGEY